MIRSASLLWTVAICTLIVPPMTVWFQCRWDPTHCCIALSYFQPNRPNYHNRSLNQNHPSLYICDNNIIARKSILYLYYLRKLTVKSIILYSLNDPSTYKHKENTIANIKNINFESFSLPICFWQKRNHLTVFCY